ncbi:MAG TPA: hypothetical protein DIW47_10220 [Bacteroidetes bacterium]|nr:hypothetical protein [Bacteroidota bacterium]
MQTKTNRIESIDVLRGLVMVIMALDHVRDYFHYGSILGDPSDLETTTPILFFTRFITHYCAPVFVFLAGTSAYLYGSKKTKGELAKFLFTRGLWLIFLEFAFNNLIWTFDLSYSFQVVQVIWTIGVSMLCLSLLIYLPKVAILGIGLVLVAGHNLLDTRIAEGESFQSLLWYVLHQQKFLVLAPDRMVVIMYPLIPWMGVMALGYCFGELYSKEYNAARRKKILIGLGLGSVALFVVLRGLNGYGDLLPWSVQDTTTKTILSFFSVTKYPPSLIFLCMTLGPAFLFLAVFENAKNKLSNFFLVYGRVPFFYYFLHMIVIHGLAILGIILSGGDWRLMILSAENVMSGKLASYGYSLPVVYLVWIGVVLLLYPLSYWYMKYKAKNKDKQWLSYL